MPQADEGDDEMTPRRGRARRWLLIAGTVVGVVALLLGGTVLYLRSRDTTTEVGVEDALGSFREAEAAAEPVDRRPQPGVYEYETVGEETIDALGGATHTYPARTTMTYTLTDCGYRTRWDVFEERFDELDLCISDAGESVQTSRQYREFFGFSADQVLQCDSSVIVRAEPTVLDDPRTTPCTASGTNAEMRVVVVGEEPIDVGGQTVDALRIQLDTTLTGEVRGTSSLEYWADPVTGLVFRQITTVKTDADSPLGTTHYQEQYTVQLVSRQPRR